MRQRLGIDYKELRLDLNATSFLSKNPRDLECRKGINKDKRKALYLEMELHRFYLV